LNFLSAHATIFISWLLLVITQARPGGSRPHGGPPPPEKLERFIAEQVKAGRYQSASEVVREALRLLQGHEEVQRLKLKALRAVIEEGLTGGPAQAGERPSKSGQIAGQLSAEE
jgi:antitoxin ParD1/3/4